MGIIRVAAEAVAGSLGDQWLERIEASNIDGSTIAAYGVVSRKNEKRNRNSKGSPNVISNGSLIQVPENTFMLLVDSGKIIAATDDPGFYQVDNSRAPSIFFKSEGDNPVAGYNNTDNNAIERPGGIENALKDTFERFKFGGSAPYEQKVVFVNLMEIPSIRFGTPNPIIFGDRKLVPGTMISTEIKAHGTYSIKVADPILFYREVMHKTGDKDFKKDDLAEQYIDEFLAAFSDAIASMAYEDCSVIELPTRQRDIGKYMATTLDEDWLKQRGFYIHSVAVRNMTYDEQTKEFINKHRNDSLLLDPNRRAARMTGGIASGIENAGSNANGAMMGFAGVGLGMNAAGGQGGLSDVMNPAGQTQATSQAASNAPAWTCSCGVQNQEAAKFCSQCGNQKPSPKSVHAEGWDCSCGTNNTGGFCSHCGAKKPEAGTWKCTCGNTNTGGFCSSCGTKKPESKTKAEFKCNNCGWTPEDPSNPPKFCPSCGDVFDLTDRL